MIETEVAPPSPKRLSAVRLKRRGVCAFLLAVTIALLPRAATQAAERFDPYDIYERARDIWSAERYPSIVPYTITIDATENGRAIERTYRAQWITSGNDVRVLGVSRQEAQAPHVARGIHVNLTMTISVGRGSSATLSVPLDNAQTDEDPIGVPRLAPAYSFGLMRAGGENAQGASAPVMPVIASVSSRDVRYDVTMEGIEQIDGVDAYHLLLQPRRDPGRNRLRELWVSESGFTPLRALIQGNFTSAPFTQIPWLITFARAGDVLYIAQEEALRPLRLRRGPTYDGLIIRFKTTDDPPETDRLLLPDFGADAMLHEPLR